MSDRIFSVVLLVLAAAYAVAAARFEVPFQYEPLGPSAWPILLAVVLGICALLVLRKPDPEPHWPKGIELRRALLLTVGLVLYAVLFEPLGFMITTTLLCLGFALMLEAPRLKAALFGLGMGVPGYWVWTRVLELNLPFGHIFK